MRALVNHEDGGAPDWTVLVRDYLDGGETLHFKVFDEWDAERGDLM